MSSRIRTLLAPLLIGCMLLMATSAVPAQTTKFSFGVIAPLFRPAQDDTVLREAIADTDADNLAFVIASGIKGDADACTDSVYLRRRSILDSAKNGLLVSLTGSDWTQCVNNRGESVAVERLNRIRELFFVDDFSFGSSRIPVMRQSVSPIFRSYAENMRWHIGNVMFATINLPAPNNHYRIEAGRNSEFEDRMIANREWLERIFTFAKQKKMNGIVLFCDGDPLIQQGFLKRLTRKPKRDGFIEIRKTLNTLSKKFSGKVLIVYNQTTGKTQHEEKIVWNGNLGKLHAHAGWVRLHVADENPMLFSAEEMTSDAKSAMK
jgi:hypothetical protein